MSWREQFEDMDPRKKLIVIAAVGLLALIIWTSFAQVDEITRGTGKVIPSSQAQLVQPSTPSVISAILVHSGEHVHKGQVLVKLDNSAAASALGQLQAENERLTARADRLAGEAAGKTMGCDEGTPCAEEQRLQQVREATARQQQAALAATVDQRIRDKQEADATAAALQKSVRLAQQQVDMLKPLAAKGIVPQTDLLTAQSDLVDKEGRLSAAQEASASAAAAIRGAQADLDAARLDFRQKALDERSQVATRIAVNEESIRGAEAKQAANELRAPVDGIVNDVQVTTVGGFVNAGEKIMQVVPVGEKLLVEGRISPRDIGFVKVGDHANVKVTAYDFSTYGGLSGTVEEISADSIYDESERKPYYRVLVRTDKSYIEKNGQKFPIVPGMITEVEIVTGSKSILSYLFNPVTRGLNEALTER